MAFAIDDNQAALFFDFERELDIPKLQILAWSGSFY